MRARTNARRLAVVGVAVGPARRRVRQLGIVEGRGFDRPLDREGRAGYHRGDGARPARRTSPSSAPGVTDKQIGVASITSTTNILGGLYGAYTDGIKAYFDYINAPRPMAAKVASTAAS